MNALEASHLFEEGECIGNIDPNGLPRKVRTKNDGEFLVGFENRTRLSLKRGDEDLGQAYRMVETALEGLVDGHIPPGNIYIANMGPHHVTCVYHDDYVSYCQFNLKVLERVGGGEG